MSAFLNFYQHIPENLNPVAFKIGFVIVTWYSLMYLLAFFTVYCLLVYRIKKEKFSYDKDQIFDFLIFALAGVIVGGRLGYVFFYDFSFYLAHPIAVISPYNFSTGQWVGIYGMSFHGGLLGVIVATLIFCRKYKINFWKWSNFIIPAIPAGYFWGRIGNFFNGELYGRVTSGQWGMYFPADFFHQLRYPSQLYEALFEGIVLFLILWTWRKNNFFGKYMITLYLFGYGFFRFFIEFYRQPDEQLGFVFYFFHMGLTLGQVFSFLMIAGACLLFCFPVKFRCHPEPAKDDKLYRGI